MPRRPSEEPLIKVTMKLFSEDHAELRRMYGNGGVSDAIRTIIRNHVITVRGSLHLPDTGEEAGEGEGEFEL